MVDNLVKPCYTTYLNNKGNTMQVGTTYQTASGGSVTITKTGLIHKAGTAYSGKIATAEEKKAKKD